MMATKFTDSGSRARRVAVRFGGALAVTLLGVAVLPGVARARKCTAKSELRIKRFNRDALDELDRWRLIQARRKLSDAALVARARGCEQSETLAMRYVILGVVEARSRRWAQMRAAWNKGLCIASWVLLPKRLVSPKLARLFRHAKATRKCKHAPRPRPRTGPARPGHRPDARPDPRVPPKPPARFEHDPPKTHRLGQHLTLRVRVADSLKSKHIRIFYRMEKKGPFKTADFLRGGGDRWTWFFRLNGVHLYVRAFRYFVVVYTAGDRPVAASGNALQLHVVKIVR